MTYTVYHENFHFHFTDRQELFRFLRSRTDSYRQECVVVTLDDEMYQRNETGDVAIDLLSMEAAE